MDLAGVREHEAETLDGEEQRAAVIVPILERDGREHLLFTKRAEHLSNHPGQMSFPGGRMEPEDEHLMATAKREGEEEICLDPADIECIGRLDDIRTVTRFLVRPFVSRIANREYSPCEHEVAEVVVLPVDGLTDLDNYHSEHRDHPYYGEIRLHYFYVDGYTVWGATARMLVQFLELATDWEAPPEVDDVVEPDAEYPV